MKDGKRIAFFGMGMVGSGPDHRGIPTLLLLFDRLAEKHDLVVYRINPGEAAPTHVKYRLKSTPSLSMPARLRDAIMAVRFLADHFMRRFAIIHALSPTPAGRVAVWLGKLTRVPVIIHLHSAEGVAFPEFAHGDLLQPRLKYLHQKICREATALTVLSASQKDWVLKHLQPDHSPVVIPRGLDLNAFVYRERKAGQTLRLLYVGYDELVKDPVGALQVFRKVMQQEDVTLHMVGDGLNTPRFVQMTEDMGIADRVTFAGTVGHDRMPGFYEEADVLLVTSLYESQSASALEAMASGVLVCGTAVGILADLKDKACIAVEPKDHDALAAEISKLWRNEERQNTLRRQARAWVVEHDANWTALQYEGLMDEIK